MTDRTERYRDGGQRRRSAGDLLVGCITGRKTKWLILVAGVVAVAVAGPLAGKLVPLENNSPNSFLPGSAASTRVLDAEESHARTATTPAVVVYQRSQGLTASDRMTVSQARHQIADGHLPGTTAAGPVSLSANGNAASFSVPISTAIAQETLGKDIAAIREIVHRGAVPTTTHPAPDILQVAVGGPAGSAADALGAFSGIDGKLLGVTVVIVAVLLLLIYRSPVLWLVPLVSVVFAAGWSEGFAYLLAKSGFVVSGMSVGILTVLVFGAGTDYALLLTARYREELRRHHDHPDAMAAALRRAGRGRPHAGRRPRQAGFWNTLRTST